METREEIKAWQEAARVAKVQADQVKKERVPVEPKSETISEQIIKKKKQASSTERVRAYRERQKEKESSGEKQ